MADNKNIISDVIPVMTKITEHKLNGSNYLEWSKTVRVYLRSIDKDDHLTKDPPTDDTRQTWLREDARLFLQLRNSIHSEAFLQSMRLLNLRFSPVLRFPLCMKRSHGSFVQRVLNLHSLPVVLLLAVIQMDNRVIEEEVEEELQATEVISVMERLVLIRTQDESFVIIAMSLAIQNIIVRNFREKNQRSQIANMAAENSTVSSSEKTILVSAEDFAQFSQYQASLKPTSSPVTAIAESGSYDEANYW
ncbi:uncharacterized protein LOC131181539 isoform X2 [Hevea brasiliensis]|uniref:uncharacterized protein LOC131181539 isoform X2 n=1 Tax=Hevea brasiliensis TaxID=3981 RepID=UPI0025FADE17|nr:uncharacterized protein LOC131181539 isoform X2 [Hevea brasiliensis]